MTRYFEWIQPDENFSPVTYRITDYEIILIYWLYWSNAVMKNRPDNSESIIPDNCIDDFVTVHWAVEINNENKCANRT